MTAIINDPTTERLERIPLDQLHASPDNPRAVGDVTELAASITEHGVVEPLVVVPRAEGGYTVVAGHRRLAASALAGGIADAPCIVRSDLDDDQAAELRLVENLHRRDLSPLEEAAGYQALVDRGYSQRKLARQVGKSQPHISRRLSLLALPAKAIEALDAGGITVEQATTLARIEPARVTELFKRGQPSDWDIRDTVRRQELDEKMAAAAKELADAGVTVVEKMPGPAWRHRLTEPGSYGLQILPEEHAGEPCHAGLVERNGAVTYVCTDPDRHEPAGESAVKERADEADDGDDDVGRAPTLGEARRDAREDPEWQAKQAAEHERMERRKAAIAARREWITSCLVLPADARTAVDLVALVAAECYSIEDYFDDQRVLDLLGIAVDTYGGGSRLDAVRAYMERGSLNRARAVAAGAAIVFEAYVTPAEWSMRADQVRLLGEDQDIARLWFTFLAEHGYSLSDHDRELVPEPEPPAEDPPPGTVAWYDDPDEGARWVDAGEADAIEGLDAARLHRLPVDAPTETTDDAESMTGGWSITVEKPARSKKWKWSCTCGETGTKTTEEYAREMGDLHLSEKHTPTEVPA